MVLIRGNATGHGKSGSLGVFLKVSFAKRPRGFLGEDIRDCGLKRCTEVRAILAQSAHPFSATMASRARSRRGFETRERQITTRGDPAAVWERQNVSGLQTCSCGFDAWPTGLRQAQKPCRLVKGFAWRVVDCASKAGELLQGRGQSETDNGHRSPRASNRERRFGR